TSGLPSRASPPFFRRGRLIMSNWLNLNLGTTAVLSLCASAFSRLPKSVRAVDGETGEAQADAASVAEREIQAREKNIEVDFENSPAKATLTPPTSPLVVAIDDLAAKSLNLAAYKEVNKQLGIFARKLLAWANYFSKQDHNGYPFSPISAAQVRKAVSHTIRDLAAENA